jgi:cell pole-organizing protein PopZ
VKEQESTKQMNNMSIEEILKSVKNIMDCKPNNASEEEVLELTDVVGVPKKSIASELQEKHLLSPDKANETSQILKHFASTAVNAKDQKKNRGIEDFVLEMLRPQIKTWLDQNLPNLVKEIVEKEIKRLIPD